MKKYIFIGVIIIIIVIIIITQLVNKKGSESTSNETIEVYEDTETIVEEYFKDKIVPQNIYKFKILYKGEVNSLSFYRKIYSFVNYIETLSKTDNIDKYYNENAYNVLNITGIDNKEDFEKLYETIKEKGITTKEYKEIKLDDTFEKVEKNGLTMKLIITYENDKEIILNTYFSNIDIDPIMSFKVIE